MNWYLAYSVAIFLDIIGFLTAILGIGLLLNRVVALLAGPSFAIAFYATGTKGWGWRLLAGDVAEEIPFLGDFTPGWTLTIWRIHRQNIEPEAAYAIQNETL